MGWQIDSDNSKLEFVTEPPVDIGALGPIVTGLADVLDRLPLRLDAPTPLGDHIPGNATADYVLLPYRKRVITGSPQGTIGIPYRRLFAFFDLLRRYEMNASQVLVGQHAAVLKQAHLDHRAMPEGNPLEQQAKQERGQALHQTDQSFKREKQQGTGAISKDKAALFGRLGTITTSAVAAHGQAIAVDGDVDRLKGLLHFVGQYLAQTTGATAGYKKKQFAVMARSSFHSMWDALGGQARTAFGPAARQVMTELGYTAETVIFPQRTSAFTVEEWLTTIEHPIAIAIPDEDEQYGRRWVDSDLMTAPGAMNEAGCNTDKSMGSMGLDEGELVVVELRTLKHFCELGTFTPQAMRSLVADLTVLINA